MNAYWITFYDRAPGCVEAESVVAAVEFASLFGRPKAGERLPHPIAPIIGESQPVVYQPNSCVERIS